jgi:hypothetical protein
LGDIGVGGWMHWHVGQSLPLRGRGLLDFLFVFFFFRFGVILLHTLFLDESLLLGSLGLNEFNLSLVYESLLFLTK